MFSPKLKICLIGPYPPPIGGMALQLKELAYRLKQEGFEVYIIKANQPLPYCIKKIYGLRTFYNFLKYLKELKKTLEKVHVLYIFAASHLYFHLIVSPAIILGKIYKKKIIVNYRGGAPQSFFKKYKAYINKLLNNTIVVVPSSYLKEVFNIFFPKINPIIIYNIAYIEKFKFRERNPIKPLFLSTRNFESYYSVEDIIEAFNLIQKEIPNAKLGLIGDGTRKKYILEKINKYDLKKQITIFGRVEHDLLPNIYDKYDIFLNASKIDNFPGSIIEAFISGLPVITTNPGGIPYIVKNNETGILVNVGDYEALAKKALEILHNQKLVNKITKNAYQQALQYSWENIKKKLIPILK